MTSAFDAIVAKLAGWWTAGLLLLPNLAAALLVVALAWLVARLASASVRRLLRQVTPYNEINGLLARLVWILTVGTGVFVALGMLGLDKTVTSLVAGAGVLTLVAGLAFQDLASNFIAGILLQLRHPFRTGHLIRTNEVYGTVEHINLRATLVRTLQGQLAVIPNREVFQKPLLNFSHFGSRRVDLSVGVTYGTDLPHAQAVARDALAALPARDPSRPPEVFYEGFGESSIDMTVRVWIPFERESEFLEARSDAVMRLKQAFDNADITIPFPIRTLDFSEVGGRRLGEEMREDARPPR